MHVRRPRAYTDELSVRLITVTLPLHYRYITVELSVPFGLLAVYYP